MLTGWWRSRQARALARNRDGTRSPAGQPRAGFGASGSRKCASSPAAPAGSRPAVSSTMIRACCQEIVPACSAARVSGSAVVRAWAVGQEGPGGPFADGQDTGDLGDHGHLLGGAFLRGRRRRRQTPGPPARSPRPAAPSAPRSGPPAGPPRPARPGNRPPAPATDQRHAGSAPGGSVRSAPIRRQPARQRTRRRPPRPPCSPHSTLPCSPHSYDLGSHRHFDRARGAAA